MYSQRQMDLAAEDIITCQETTYGTPPDLQGAFIILKRWYRHASARQTNSSRADLEKVSGEHAALYRREYPFPLGRSVSSHVSPFQIDNGVLMET